MVDRQNPQELGPGSVIHRKIQNFIARLDAQLIAWYNKSVAKAETLFLTCRLRVSGCIIYHSAWGAVYQ